MPNPDDLTSVTGGGTNRTIQQDLRGPYVDEWTAGVDVGLSRTLTLQFNYVYKTDGLANKRLNLATPYDAFTLSNTATDPGRDNVLGTADDRPDRKSVV